MARPALFVDAGALIALANNRDRFHSSISKTLAEYFGDLLTTWPAATEACQFLATDRTDFEIYRTKSGQRFEILP